MIFKITTKLEITEKGSLKLSMAPWTKKSIMTLGLFLSLWSWGLANVTSGTGSIEFDVNGDGISEAKLEATGLAVGKNLEASANIHVAGNAIVTTQLTVGQSALGSSNLTISGSMGLSFQKVSDNVTLGNHSLVLADSSGGNIILTLPDAEDVIGSIYRIKKVHAENDVRIKGGGLIDDAYSITFASGNRGAIAVQSTGTWQYRIISTYGGLVKGTVVASENLVGWWKLDENSGIVSEDSGLGNNDGAINNMAAGNVGVDGKVGLALDFDGVNDVVTVPDSSSLRITPKYSFAMWIYPKTLDGVIRQIFIKRGAGSRTAFGLWIWNTNVLYSVVGESGGNRNITGTTTLVANTWHHVVVTYDQSDLKLYLNGNLDQTASHPNVNIIHGAYDLTIGDGPWGNPPYHGLIDEITLYDVALSSYEVQYLYNQ